MIQQHHQVVKVIVGVQCYLRDIPGGGGGFLIVHCPAPF